MSLFLFDDLRQEVSAAIGAAKKEIDEMDTATEIDVDEEADTFNTAEDHPVVSELLRGNAVWMDRRAVPTVLRHGRAFVGVGRPKSYRQRALKNCLRNAGDLAISDRGRYVEGFAISASGLCCQHAWITLDGVHAIDVTWPEAPACHYFGIEFPQPVLARWVRRRGYWGLLDPVDDEMLRDAGLL